jgi:hypothetical protein
MFRIGIFKRTSSEGGQYLLYWLKTEYESHAQASSACDRKNTTMGIKKDAHGFNIVELGQKFAMYDDVE